LKYQRVHINTILPHLVIFLICFFILTGGFLLNVSGDSIKTAFFSISIPEICTFKNLTGLPCPGCGLTRSIVSAVHGNIKESFNYHRLGLLTISYLFAQLIFRLIIIIFPFLLIKYKKISNFLNKGIILLAILFVFNWLYTLTLKL